MLCKKCGKEIPEDSQFCMSCGANLKNKIEQSVDENSDTTVKTRDEQSTDEDNTTQDTVSVSSIIKSLSNTQKILGWIVIFVILPAVVTMGLFEIFPFNTKTAGEWPMQVTNRNDKTVTAENITLAGEDSEISVGVVGHGSTDLAGIEMEYSEIASAASDANPSRVINSNGYGAKHEELPSQETLDRMNKFNPEITKRIIDKGYIDNGSPCFVLLDDNGCCISTVGVLRERRVLHDSGENIYLKEIAVKKSDFKWLFIPCSDGKTCAKVLAYPMNAFFDETAPGVDRTQDLYGTYSEDSYQEFVTPSDKTMVVWESLDWPTEFPSN